MPVLLPQKYEISEGDNRAAAINYADILRDGELLTGTPTVVPSPSLTITGIAVNTMAEQILGETVQPGQAVIFRIRDGTEGMSPYRLLVTVDTTGGQTFVFEIKLSWT